MASTQVEINYSELAQNIKAWARELGFAHAGVSDIDVSAAEAHLLNWLARGYHGAMNYMERHGYKRSRPADLVPGTLRIISVRMNYWPPNATDPQGVLGNPEAAYISRYALGRDYHTVVRKRLQALATRIETVVGAFGYRVFSDSAPVLEKALAEKAGIGWIGKHTNLIHEKSGSWFFLGEIYTDLPLPIDAPATNHCGTCMACIPACPTNAIIAPYQLDARRCISYLTIEWRGSIPEEYRAEMGNRIYGCDDCQLVCPWTKFTQTTTEPDFVARHQLDDVALTDLFEWTEDEFLRRMEGSAIRRIGYSCWLRNIAVALGNAPSTPRVLEVLRKKIHHENELVREHVAWALARHENALP